MADISKITLPNNSTYDLKDSSAVHSETESTTSAAQVIHTGTTDPASVSTTGWNVGDLYIYVKS